MKRKIIKIDEKKCNGCGICVPSCAEGALQILDGKARLISDLFCDGLGACIGDCPEGAISIEEREAEPYDELKVMDTIVEGGPNVIKAHLNHLKEHNEMQYYKTALDYLAERNIPNPLINDIIKGPKSFSCPGTRNKAFENDQERRISDSELSHWPIQMHLINPGANHFKNSDLILTADCCAYAYGNFHNDFLKNKNVCIACPKLDTQKEVYKAKLISLIDDAMLNTLSVIIMEVPCCRGLLALAKEAVETAQRKVPLKLIIIGIKGEKLREEWL